MKKSFLMVALASLLLSSCGTVAQTSNTSTGTSASSGSTGVLGSILSSATNGKTIANAISSVIGLNKLTAENLVGTWKYSEPGAAFTSENLLTKAGGEVAATEVRQKLADPYKKVGINSQNTQITFNSDGTFSSTIAGKSFSGTYTFDASTSALKLKGLVLSLNGYATRSGVSGVSVLFESKKVLTLLQTLSAVSGNTTLATIGNLSTNYDGVRVGFDMTK